MIEFEEAQALLAATIRPLTTETVGLIEAGGRFLAEAVHAAVSSPRRDVSAMDGYALRSADAAVGARFRIVGESFAGGARPPAIGPGKTVRIFTGAAMPEGADRVVMQENCSAEAGTMAIIAEFGPGWHVRAKGSDFSTGDALLQPGRKLDPRGVLALAAADRCQVQVYRRPRVAIIATGDELIPPGTARDHPLSIPESVSFGVAAMAEQCGATVVERLRGSDDLAGLSRLAGRALAAANVVVVTGGASVGERDFAKAMFAEHDLELLFSKVAIKPGKPFWIGQAQGRWVVGLPGNPTSAMVTARLFLVPLLWALQGGEFGDAMDWEVRTLLSAPPRAPDRLTLLRARPVEGGLAAITNQDSSAQNALTDATWLVRCNPGDDAEAHPRQVKALRF